MPVPPESVEIRTSGVIKRKDVREGEAFQYVDVLAHGAYKYMVGGSVTVPSDWSFASTTSYSEPHADDEVTLIPRWDALRTSGVIKRKDVREGEAFYYNPTPSVKFLQKSAASHSLLPNGWRIVSGFGSLGSLDVTLIPRWDAAPALRTSGEIFRKDVLLGEAFQYLEGGQKLRSDKFIRADIRPSDLPADWRYSMDTSLGGYMVRLIPHYRTAVVVEPAAAPVLRTSGEMLRKDVRLGEAFVYLEGGFVENKFFVRADSRPSDLPKNWDFSAEGLPGHRVRLISHYLAVPALRTSGEMLRKDVRPGEAYVNVARPNDKIIISTDGKYPADLPKGWLWNVYPATEDVANEKVRLIPSYRTVESDVLVATLPQYKHGNSGRTYSFVAGKNIYTSELGWKPLDLAGSGKALGFDPVSSVMAVHDLMEHFPGDEYAPHNEYMAQGAMLWLRFEGGFFAGKDLAEAVVKPAFGMLYHHVVRGELDTKKFDGLRDPFVFMKRDTAYVLMSLITATEKFARSVYSGAKLNRVLDSLAAGIPWMVEGYLLADKRYVGLDKKKLVRLYQATVAQIANVVDGGRLKLTMNYEKYTADVELATSVGVL